MFWFGWCSRISGAGTAERERNDGATRAAYLHAMLHEIPQSDRKLTPYTLSQLLILRYIRL